MKPQPQGNRSLEGSFSPLTPQSGGVAPHKNDGILAVFNVPRWASPLLGCVAVIALAGCAVGPSAPRTDPFAPRPLPLLTAPPVFAPPPPSSAAGATPLGPLPPADADAHEDAHDASEAVDDDDELYDAAAALPPLPAGAASAPPTAAASPLLALSDAEIHARFKKDPASLGPISVGKPNAGALVNGLMMPKDTKWIVLEPGLAWGTQETIDAISKSIERVHAQFPGSQAIPIGHISSKDGGYLPVHKSHQAGRDVDIGYYFTTPKKGFVTGTQANLDLGRTLAFIKALLANAPIEMILVDTSIQKLLADYAASHGDDAAWIDRTFQVRQKIVGAPVRHVRGHHNHIHVRFASPQAVAMGKRVAGLVAIRSAPPAKGTPPASATASIQGDKIVPHRARSGDTLAVLARRYGTTVEAIRRANHLKGDALKAGHVYQIPVPPPPVRGAPLPKAAPQLKTPAKSKS